MKIVLDTHSHTIASGHAYNTIREMAQMASQKGLEAISLTEHAVTMPGTCHDYYFENFHVIPREMYGVKLFLGVELNIMDENGTVDMPEKTLERMDIAIASIHPPCYKGEVSKEAITNAYMKAMENPRIHIIGHPDDARFPVDYEAIVKKAKETGTLIEINNSSLRPTSFRLGARENDKTILELCKKYQVMISLGSDAHFDLDLAAYECAMELLEECDFPEELVVNTSVKKLEKLLAI